MFQLAYLYAQQQRGLTPDIWLQDPRHFEGSEDYIKRVFGEGIKPQPYVSLHVRRGDYVKHRMFVQLWETDYYDQAIALFPGEQFLVFSDDIEWCKKHWGMHERGLAERFGYSSDRFNFVTPGDEIQDLNLMAGCRSNIIANSSFSWWAGFLNPNPNKTVVYPLAWHTDGVQRVGFPKEWRGL
jgi:hypothetical protein